MQSSTNTFQHQTRIFLSLGGLFFFGPYVKYFLQKTSLVIDNDSRQFILGYAKVGYFNILLALLVAILGGYDFLYPTMTLQFIYTVILYILVAILVIGSVLVFLHTPLFVGSSMGEGLKIEKITDSQTDILKSFIPGYNIYLWYKVHQFAHPFRWLKEGLLWNLLFFLVVALTHSLFFSLLLILLFIIRLVTLLAGMDILPEKAKLFIHRMFLVNIEEIWADCKAFIHYAYLKVLQKKSDISYDFLAQDYRKEYATLYSFESHTGLIVEYVLLSLFFLFYSYLIATSTLFGVSLGLEVVMMLLLLVRYLVMIPYKQFPYVPLIHEFVVFLHWLARRLGILQ